MSACTLTIPPPQSAANSVERDPVLLSLSIVDANDHTLSSIELTEGAQTHVRAIGTYDLGGGRGEWTTSVTPEWSVDSASVATVSADGLVRAVVNGTATVTAKYEGQSATATIIVR